MKVYDFGDKLEFSQGVVASTCKDIIKEMLIGCIDVVDTNDNIELNKKGIDYIATLRRGATVGIDHKAREGGASKYWFNGPEIALEIWSVKPKNDSPGKPGWSLDESKETDYTLHTFHENDSNKVYLLPFQLLRIAFRKNYNNWLSQYKTATQSSGTWKSECVFVPAVIVLDAIKECSISEINNGKR